METAFPLQHEVGYFNYNYPGLIYSMKLSWDLREQGSYRAGESGGVEYLRILAR